MREQGPLCFGPTEVGTQIEQGALADLVAKAFGFDQAQGKVIGTVVGSGSDTTDEHGGHCRRLGGQLQLQYHI